METPAETLKKVNRLNQEFESLRTDLLVDVNGVEDRMVRPLQQAKDMLSPLKKTIKKREDKKVSIGFLTLAVEAIVNHLITAGL